MPLCGHTFRLSCRGAIRKGVSKYIGSQHYRKLPVCSSLCKVCVSDTFPGLIHVSSPRTIHDAFAYHHRQMISQATGGAILLIASMSAHIVNYPQPQMAYNVSKAAVLHLTKSLAAEWARYGIRVNSISPGYMDTIQTQGPGIQDAKDIWTSRNPMGRIGQPEELEGAIVLLCGKRSGSYINGSDIVLDGGQSVF